MIKTRYLLPILFLAAISINACKSDDPAPSTVTGIQGSTGNTGLAGATGATGLQGATGPGGPQGVAGTTGANGIAGTNGNTGATGSTGATGADGIAGSPGTPGSPGVQGATGATGSADVQSYLFLSQTVAPLGDITFNVPAITQSIVTQGVILVYVRNSGSNMWYPLPYSEAGDTLTVEDYGVGFVAVKPNFNGTNLDFRIVVIAGTNVTTLMVTHPGVNIYNYAQLASALHLAN
jgi:hypothetical protein